MNCSGSTRRLGRIVGLLLGFKLLRVAAVLIVRGRLRTGGRSGAQNDLKRRVNVTATNDEHVIAGPVEEVQEQVAPGSVSAEDALILGESFQFGTRVSGDLMQNLVEAGIERFDFEAATVPVHPGLVWRLAGGKIGADEAGGRHQQHFTERLLRPGSRQPNDMVWGQREVLA
jgi:hypothetical protein